MLYHLFLWEADYEDDKGAMMGGELKHYIFEDEREVVAYLNQMEREINNGPSFAGEFGLVRRKRMSVSDLVDNGYLFVIKGADLSLVMDGSNGSVEGLEEIE